MLPWKQGWCENLSDKIAVGIDNWPQRSADLVLKAFVCKQLCTYSTLDSLRHSFSHMQWNVLHTMFTLVTLSYDVTIDVTIATVWYLW